MLATTIADHCLRYFWYLTVIKNSVLPLGPFIGLSLIFKTLLRPILLNHSLISLQIRWWIMKSFTTPFLVSFFFDSNWGLIKAIMTLSFFNKCKFGSITFFKLIKLTSQTIISIFWSIIFLSRYLALVCGILIILLFDFLKISLSYHC